MNSIAAFFVGIFQATLGFFGVHSDVPREPLNFGIGGNAGAQEVLSPQEVVDQYKALPRGIANEPSATLRTSTMQYKSPEGWKNEGAGIFVSPGYVRAVQLSTMGAAAENLNPVLSGARVQVRYEEERVAENVNTPDTFADFTLSVLKACSNCTDIKKIIVDGNPAVSYASYADDHGGNFFLTGLFNNKTYSVVFNYAYSQEMYKQVFDVLVESIRFIPERMPELTQESTINADMPPSDATSLREFSDPATGISFSYPFSWTITGSEKAHGDYHILARAVNPKYPGKPDTDVPSEKLVIHRMNSMPCSGELSRLAGQDVFDTGWSASGMGGTWLRTICFPKGMPLYIVASAIQESSKELLDRSIASFTFLPQ